MIRVIQDCKKLLRDDSNLVKVDAVFRSNNYYDTEIFSVNSRDKEVFSLRVETDSISVDYKLSCDGNCYIPQGWYQTVKMKNLRRLLKRKMEKQKKLVERKVRVSYGER